MREPREGKSRHTHVLVRPVNLVLDGRLLFVQLGELGREGRIDAELVLFGGGQIDRLLNHRLERCEVGHEALAGENDRETGNGFRMGVEMDLERVRLYSRAEKKGLRAMKCNANKTAMAGGQPQPTNSPKTARRPNYSSLD